MGYQLDEYGRVLQCPLCSGTEIVYFKNVNRYLCMLCDFVGKKEDFRAIPNVVLNPSRRDENPECLFIFSKEQGEEN